MEPRFPPAYFYIPSRTAVSSSIIMIIIVIVTGIIVTIRLEYTPELAS